jgi:UDP-N-acetylglucosamine 4,6-dehydratase/5-epimerase
MHIFKNKTVLIFGGTGSFGQAFLNKILRSSSINEVRIFSRDEKKQEDLRKLIRNKKVKFYIGDVRDKDSVFEVTKNVDFAFHAAALKQVPSCEFYPMEAIKTNIIGTKNIIDACIFNGVKKLVCLSTDKAVFPINVMGMTKALMEKIAIAKSRNSKIKQTEIMITRYGNVLFSRGSVLPLFIKQILNKDFITITDPTMTRFLMSLEDAIDLVLYALIYGKNGTIYIPKTSATSIKILVDSLLSIYKYPKSKIKIIGTRHGEKNYETLMSSEEFLCSKDYGKYYAIQSDSRELNHDLYFKIGKKNINKISDYTSQNTDQLDKLKTINLIKPLLKNYSI